MTDENQKPTGEVLPNAEPTRDEAQNMNSEADKMGANADTASSMNAPIQEDIPAGAGAADVPVDTKAKIDNTEPRQTDAAKPARKAATATDGATKRSPKATAAAKPDVTDDGTTDGAANGTTKRAPKSAAATKPAVAADDGATPADAPVPAKAPTRKKAVDAQVVKAAVKEKPTVEGAINPISATPEPSAEANASTEDPTAVPPVDKKPARAAKAKPAAKANGEGTAETQPTDVAKRAPKSVAAAVDGAAPTPESVVAAAAPVAAKPAPKAAVTDEAGKPAPKAAAVDGASPVAKAAATAADDAAPAASPAAPDAPAAKPAPAKKAPPPPDPRAEEAKAVAETVKAAIIGKLGADSVEEVGAAHYKPMVRIRREDWLSAVEVLRAHEAWQLNYIECMAGTDYSDYIEIAIFIQSTSLGHFICLKTRTPRENAEVPSLVSAHPGVNWEEREIYDLLGVTFTDHPDMRRIMMWDEFTGHPLRKDYSEWE